jgi:hypothetical protein
MDEEAESTQIFVGGNKIHLSDDIDREEEEALRAERLRSLGHFAKEHIWSEEDWNLVQRYFGYLSEDELLMNSDLVTSYLEDQHDQMVANSVWEPEIPHEETTIRRYLSLDKFMLLLEDSQLWFSKSNVFEDKYEGTFPHPHIDRQKQIDQQRIAELGLPEETIDFEKHSTNQQLELANKNTYINCWRWGDDESAVFWNAYIGDDLGVSIEATIDQFSRSIEMCVSTGHIDIEMLIERVKRKFGHGQLHYDLEDLLILELSKLQIGRVEYLDYDNDPIPNAEFSRFFHKRKAFSDEQEFRALFRQNKPGQVEDDTEGIGVSIDLEKLINKVWLKPNSPDWFEDVIKYVVDDHGLDRGIVKKSKFDDTRPDQGKAAYAANYSLFGADLDNPNDGFKIEDRFTNYQQIRPTLHEQSDRDQK